MKLIELHAYREFMFATVPTLMDFRPAASPESERESVAEAIDKAQFLWSAIDKHVLEVAAELEKEPE